MTADGSILTYSTAIGRGRWLAPGDVDFPGTGPTGPTGPTGDDGPTGPTGPVGSSSFPVGIQLPGPWFYDDTTSGDPGEGFVRFNNATLASATEMYIDNLNLDSVDQTALIDAWDASTNPNPKGYLHIADANNPGQNGILNVTITGPVVNSTGYRTIPVTVTVPTGTPIVNGEPIAIVFVQVGDKGADALP